MDRPEITAAYALAALDGGARGLRIEGIGNLRAVRAVTDAPLIGLIKRDLARSDVRITPLVDDVRAIADAGADIIAFDATDRPRPAQVDALLEAIAASGRIAMADCATLADAARAAKAGAQIVATTMSGYTDNATPNEPDFELLAQLPALGQFVIAEGRYHRPDQAARAIALGADAVVVGSAVTRPEHITGWFAQAVAREAATDARYA